MSLLVREIQGFESPHSANQLTHINNMETTIEKRVKLVFTIKRVQDAMNTRVEDRTSEHRQVLRRTWDILNHIGYHKVN